MFIQYFSTKLWLMKIPVALGSISAQKENIKDVHSFKDNKTV